MKKHVREKEREHVRRRGMRIARSRRRKEKQKR